MDLNKVSCYIQLDNINMRDYFGPVTCFQVRIDDVFIPETASMMHSESLDSPLSPFESNDMGMDSPNH